MTRLIFLNKVGKNENNYIIGSNVGSQSRFARSALKKRASNNALGKCCEYKDKPAPASAPPASAPPASAPPAPAPAPAPAYYS